MEVGLGEVEGVVAGKLLFNLVGPVLKDINIVEDDEDIVRDQGEVLVVVGVKGEGGEGIEGKEGGGVMEASMRRWRAKE